MRVLFICQFFAPDITAAAFRMSDLSRLLAAAGDEVRVITTYPHKVVIQEVDDTEFEQAGILVRRCRIPIVTGTGARAYLRHYLPFIWRSLRLGVQTWREGWRPDVVYVSSPPLFVGISGWLLAKLFRRPMVFEVRDIWPDAAVSAGQLSADGRAFRWGQRLERFLYRRAAHITCVAEPMKDYLQEYARVPITVIYNGVSDAMVAIETPSQPTPADGDARMVLYAGNLGHVQQTDLLLRGFANLVRESKLVGWRIELLGAGSQLGNLERLSQELGVADRVVFHGAVARDEAAKRMRQADLLFLHVMGDATMERTIPSKLFDYLLAGRPIVGGLGGEGRDILKSTNANIVFPPGDLEGLQDGLLQATGTQWAKLDRAAIENRQLVTERFTRRESARELRAVFESFRENSR